jgi:D-alanyl-D-alanine carboxypeptidase
MPVTHHPRRRSARPAPGRLKVGAAVVGATLLLGACSSDSGSSGGSSTETTASAGASGALLAFDTAAMDAAVEEMATAQREPGMVVLITTPEGEYVKTYGVTERGGSTPVTLDTKVRIGSNTKTWTGTVIMQMVQEGKLALEDPVSRYRPDVPNGDDITIAQLGDMRSGLFNYTETLEVNRALDDDKDRVWTPEELVAIGLANPPYFPPGQGWHYSNTNTALLGLIAEQIDGKPIAQIFEDRLFTPLGLKGTSFPANTDTSIPAPSSHGYMYGTNVETMENPSIPADQLAAVEAGTLDPADVTNDNPSWTWAAGQGISTANDLAAWVKAMVGGELLDAETQEARLATVKPTGNDPESPSYGFTLAQMGPLLGHTGELPGFNSFMGYDPVNDVTIVVWANLAPGADGTAPAVELVKELLPFVYAPGEQRSDAVDDTLPD